MNDRINYAPCGYFSLNSQGIIEQVNQTFASIIGFSLNDLVGKHIDTLLTTASKMIFDSLFLPQLKTTGWVEQINLTLLGNNGEEVPVLLMGTKAHSQGEEMIDCVTVQRAGRDQYEKELESMEKELEKVYRSEKHFRKLFETTIFSVDEAIVVTDSLGRVTMMNALAESYTGCMADDARGQAFGDVFEIIDQQTKNRMDIFLHVTTQNSLSGTLDGLVLVSKGGTHRHITGKVTFMISADKGASGLVITFRDITKEYLQEQEILGLLDAHTDMLCVLTTDGIFKRINQKFKEIFGYSGEELYGKNYLDFVKEDPSETETVASFKKDNMPSSFINWFRCRDGSYKYTEWSRQFVTCEFIYVSLKDITQKQQREQEHFQDAVHDELTGLYDRRYLDTYLERQAKEDEEGNSLLTLAILDLDHFKRVNDNWGYAVGDDLLRIIASTAGENIRSDDMFVRFGGEKFVMVMPHTDIHSAILVLEGVRMAIEKLRHPIVGKQTVSIGVAQRQKKETFLEWYERADGALCRAKQQGRNRIASS